jgi:hypothetical protein
MAMKGTVIGVICEMFMNIQRSSASINCSLEALNAKMTLVLLSASADASRFPVSFTGNPLLSSASMYCRLQVHSYILPVPFHLREYHEVGTSDP